jgi:hypothetical protein
MSCKRAIVTALLASVALGGATTAGAEDVVRTADVRARALAWEAASGRVVAVGTRVSDVLSSGVFWIDPETGAVDHALPVGFTPETAAFSDDGAVAYVASGTTIVRVDVTARAVTQSFTAGTVPGKSEVASLVAEMSVLPGSHDTVAVARLDPSRWPTPYAGVAMFDAGVVRPGVSTGDTVLAERFESLATDGDSAFVVTYASAGPTLRRIALGPQGAADDTQAHTEETTLGMYGRLHLAGGRLYADWGGVADATTLQFLPRLGVPGESWMAAGSTYCTGAVLPEPGQARVYVLDPPLLEVRSLPGAAWQGTCRYAHSAQVYSATPRASLVKIAEGRFALTTWEGVFLVETDFVPQPTGLVAAPPADPTGPVSLQWTDESPDETSFTIERRRDLGDWDVAGTVPAGVTQWQDALDGVRVTGATYDYRVRAERPAGPSDWSATASANLPTAVGFVIESGTIRDARAHLKDRVILVGKLYRRSSAYDFHPNPRRQGAEVTIRCGDDIFRAVIPARGPRWRRRTISGLPVDVYTSPRGELPVFQFGWVPSRHYVILVMSGQDLAAPPSNPVTTYVRVGGDGVLESRQWKERGPRELGVGHPIPGL